MTKALKKMFNKRNIPVIFLLVLAGLVIGLRSQGFGVLNSPTRYEKILHNVGEMLSQIHFNPKKINDDFSKEVFKRYLASEKIDPQKNIFLQSDIRELKKFETLLDDEIRGGKVQFVPAVSALLNKRLPEVEQLYKSILEKPFDFTVDEKVNLDPEKNDFPASEAERRELWRKRLKYLTLDRYADLLEGRAKDSANTKTDAELESEAREMVGKAMARLFDRLMVVFNEDARFNDYVKTISETMDPHTTFFPPVDKRYFDEQMSGSFFGIGASLRDEDGVIKIATLITGSPAWKSGEINVGDIIVKVAQGTDEPVDLAGYFVEDAVKIIRGAKGTEVRLTLRKTDGSTKVVSIIRDEIIQDESYARSAIVKSGNSKIGFIYLPEFYANFENAKGRRSYEDVRKEVIRLKEQQIDGIIMDLRGNGGGSLYDVVQMVGLFIEEGPIVQVKDRDGKPQIYRDRDKSVLYDGPLAVMVNEFSASASEIFAAAIQDYNRGVIIGSSSTYGKGTVQRNIGLDRALGMLNPNSDLGTVKLTLQKFYRINGGSTQLRGVSSDITIPDVFEYSPLREKDNPNALAWDEIAKTDYKNWQYSLDLKPIIQSSTKRIQTDPAFSEIARSAKWLADQNNNVSTLNLKQYQEEQKLIRDRVQSIEKVSKLQDSLAVSALDEDLKRLAYDEGKTERYKSWIKNLSSDIYLGEALNVINDMITQDQLVYRSRK